MRAILFLILILLAPAPQASAHNLKVTLLTFDLVITDKEISLHYITGVNSIYASKIAEEMDASPADMNFSEQEKEVWCINRLENIDVLLNNKKVDLKIKGWNVPLFENFLLAQNEDDTIIVEASFEAGESGFRSGDHTLRMVDHNLGGAPRQFTHQVIFLDNMEQQSLGGLRKGALDIGFTVSDRKSTLALNPGPFLERDASRAQPKKEGSLTVWSEKNFKSLMKRDDLSIFSLVIALILAFVYGMTHAISPGHGKTMVAAYLVGSRGRILDAVFLGMVVTLTHTGSVLLLGAIVLWLQEYIMPETLTPFLQIISGIIIFLLGIWLFMSRVFLKKHALPNAHRHEHHHRDGILSHNHVEREISDEIKKNVSWWELLLLGMSGGIVPCPAALVVLLAAMVMKKLVFGMALILSFSAGLAVVLIFIGVFMVMAKNLLNGFERFDSFSRVMPAISSIGVIVIGVFIIFQALVQGGFLG